MSFFRAWRSVTACCNGCGDEDYDSAEFEEEEEEMDACTEEEEDEDKEELGDGIWNWCCSAIWYTGLILVAGLALLILLPHIYVAMPPCDSSSELLQRVKC